jgi:hypothetical protein
MSSMRHMLLQTLAATSIACSASITLGAGDPRSADLSFGAATGAAGSFNPVFAQPPAAGSEWGGVEKASCMGTDFKTFTQNFRAQELITTMANNYIGGIQQVALNYLLAVNTANPQLAAALDVMDRSMATRFQSFSSLCAAVDLRRNSGDAAVKRAAEANAQCFAIKVTTSGASPDEAMRDCAKPSSYGSLGIPAEKDNYAYLKDHSALAASANVEQLTALLPDQKLDNNGLQVRAPKKSLTQVKSSIEDKAKVAMLRVLAGSSPMSIAECTSAQMISDDAAANGCMPPHALSLVRSESFLAARLLPPAQQEMYASAISEQVASLSLRSLVQELSGTVETMGAKNVDAREASARQAQMRLDVRRLADDADNLSKISEARANIAKTNLLAARQSEAITKRHADKYANLDTNGQRSSFTQKLLGFLNP